MSRSLQMLKSRLWGRAQKEQDKERKEDYRLMHEIAQDAEYEFDKLLAEMEMLAIRNPSFVGDEMGRPDDDFEPPRKDDEDKKDEKKD